MANLQSACAVTTSFQRLEKLEGALADDCLPILPFVYWETIVHFQVLDNIVFHFSLSQRRKFASYKLPRYHIGWPGESFNKKLAFSHKAEFVFGNQKNNNKKKFLFYSKEFIKFATCKALDNQKRNFYRFSLQYSIIAETFVSLISQLFNRYEISISYFCNIQQPQRNFFGLYPQHLKIAQEISNIFKHNKTNFVSSFFSLQPRFSASWATPNSCAI